MKLIRGLKRRTLRWKKRILLYLSWISNACLRKDIRSQSYKSALSEFREFVSLHENVTYSAKMTEGSVVFENTQFKYVGAQAIGNQVFFIPNGASRVCIYDTKKHTFKMPPFNCGYDDFKWTGGGLFGDELVCFPRTQNSLLFVNVSSQIVRIAELDTNYNSEHHYGGVITSQGILFQPPRNTDHILKITLDSKVVEKIPITLQPKRVKFRYCGSIRHPNGLIYFLPETYGRVIEFDPVSENYRFIGKPVYTSCFDPCVAPDGIIYGFCAYSPGLIMINVENSTVNTICSEYGITGCYGTKMGINGKLYGIPGDGNSFLEFDPVTKTIKELCRIKKEEKAKWAGGVVLRDGSIVCSPAQSNEVFIVAPDWGQDIPESIYKNFFLDNY